MATITVRGHFALPHSQKAKRKENVVWVEPAGAMVHIVFVDKTPVDFRTDNPARARVIGVVKDDADIGSYPYRLGGSAESGPEPVATDGSVLSDPELIVDGGLIPKRKRTKRTKRTKRAVSKRATKAGKRAPAKRAKPARRRKTTKRVKSTSRVSARKRATKKR